MDGVGGLLDLFVWGGLEAAVADDEAAVDEDVGDRAAVGVKEVVEWFGGAAADADEGAADIDGDEVGGGSGGDAAEVRAVEGVGRDGGGSGDGICDGGSAEGGGADVAEEGFAGLAVEDGELEVFEHVVGVSVDGDVGEKVVAEGFRIGLGGAACAAAGGAVGVDEVFLEQDLRIAVPI